MLTFCVVYTIMYTCTPRLLNEQFLFDRSKSDYFFTLVTHCNESLMLSRLDVTLPVEDGVDSKLVDVVRQVRQFAGR